MLKPTNTKRIKSLENAAGRTFTKIAEMCGRANDQATRISAIDDRVGNLSDAIDENACRIISRDALCEEHVERTTALETHLGALEAFVHNLKPAEPSDAVDSTLNCHSRRIDDAVDRIDDVSSRTDAAHAQSARITDLEERANGAHVARAGTQESLRSLYLRVESCERHNVNRIDEITCANKSRKIDTDCLADRLTALESAAIKPKPPLITLDRFGTICAYTLFLVMSAVVAWGLSVLGGAAIALFTWTTLHTAWACLIAVLAIPFPAAWVMHRLGELHWLYVPTLMTFITAGATALVASCIAFEAVYS